MALNESALKTSLLAIFNEMDEAATEEPKTNEWYAGKLAKAITDHIKTAEAAAGIDVQGGTQTGGALVGAATSANGKII
ncbi:MAG: hypothetical protein LBO04_02500 [Spirochaetaceae bacterium]|jgi:hypothetical protein|nr:hypothetical protein [Spirochaetaceae bacterium]